jgi:hypothetical protein
MLKITLDVSKINKSKIIDRKYTNRTGQEITAKEYKIDVIPCKEIKVVASGDTWVMKKTHFVVEAQTKEENTQNVATNYVGEGFEFEKKEAVAMPNIDPDTGINCDDIPF